jgi:hypothetical protein
LGRLVFRPGGHGALLHNLQALADHGHAQLIIKTSITSPIPGFGRSRLSGSAFWRAYWPSWGPKSAPCGWRAWSPTQGT